MLKLFFRGGLAAFLLAAPIVTSGIDHPFSGADSETNPFNASMLRATDGYLSVHLMSATDPDSLAPYMEYQDNITSLIDYFGKKEIALNELLQDSRFEIYDTIGDKFRHSAEKKSLGLDEYKRILRFEDKRGRIIDFINTHAEPLAKAEETYGISRYVIAAIIGVESDFGTKTGTYNPFNTYVSMYAVGYREKFARAQLEELLIWVKRNEIDVFELKSSYAGAMAYAQFIPYSLNKWFVGSDIFDMGNNIQSVANYLAYFKKRTGTIEKAVFRYNPSSLYAGIVMDLAKEAESLYSDSSAGR